MYNKKALEDIGEKIIKTTNIKEFDLKDEERMFEYEIDVGLFLRILSSCYENVLGITSCDLKKEEYVFGASFRIFHKIVAVVSIQNFMVRILIMAY